MNADKRRKIVFQFGRVFEEHFEEEETFSEIKRYLQAPQNQRNNWIVPNIRRKSKIKTIFSENDYDRMLQELKHFRPKEKCEDAGGLYQLNTYGFYESFQVTKSYYRKYQELTRSRVCLCVEITYKFKKTFYTIKHFGGYI